MKYRSPLAVFLLPFVTLGIYGIYWEVKTKGEMNILGAEIPTAWWLIVPIANIWWLWKYGQGVEKVTGGKLSGALSFVLLWLLGTIGAAIIQDSFNNVGATAPIAGAPATAIPAPVTDTAVTPNTITPQADSPVETPAPPADVTAPTEQPTTTPPTNPVQ